MSTQPRTIAETRSPKRRTRWLRWSLILGMPVALFAGSVGIFWYLAQSKLSKAIALADQLDPGWRLEELEAQRKPEPPPGKNGSDQVLSVQAALNLRTYPQWSFPGYHDRASLQAIQLEMSKSLYGDRKAPTALNDEQLRVLRAEAKRTEPALALACDLVKYPGGRFPIKYTKDYFSTDDSHAEAARLVVDLLRYDAILRAHERDMAGALQDVKAIVYTSRSIGDEPILFSQLMRMGINQSAVLALERVLGFGEASERDLLDMQQCLLQEAEAPFFLTAARGVRAGLDRLLNSIARGETTFAQFSTIFMKGRRPDSWDQVYLWQIQFTISTYRATALNLTTKMVEISKLPSEKRLAAFKEWEAWLRFAMPSKVAQMLLLDVRKNAEWDLAVRARLRSAATCVAAERFRLAKGRWPANLAELVPGFLDAVPTDPFDGLPLRLKRGDSIFVVYSVFMDEIDDGGQIGEQLAIYGSDIGFQLFDPEKRRQPAKPFVFPPVRLEKP